MRLYLTYIDKGDDILHHPLIEYASSKEEMLNYYSTFYVNKHYDNTVTRDISEFTPEFKMAQDVLKMDSYHSRVYLLGQLIKSPYQGLLV